MKPCSLGVSPAPATKGTFDSHHAQVAAGHVGGFVEAEEGEHRGGYVFEGSVGAEFGAEGVGVDEVEGNGVVRVGRVGLACGGVYHLLAVDSPHHRPTP